MVGEGGGWSSLLESMLLRLEEAPEASKGDASESWRRCAAGLSLRRVGVDAPGAASVSVGLVRLVVDDRAPSLLVPGILALRELLTDREEPWVSDFENEGRDSSRGPRPDALFLLLLEASPSLEG